ncbi:uncharacterized protein [Nicotiana sylvestris]|uniref:uncharacterized protein n=1 Tax=Nicotiana sylvestris TaxID=4096 RepID=UPI00388CE638
MKVWSADFDFNKEILQTIHVWVRYPNLPLNCWGAKSLSKISSGLEIPLYADACTTRLDRISYARVLIEMDVNKELLRAIKVTYPNGREFMQEVAYDWIPEFCHTCLQVGHKCNKREQLAPKPRPKQQKQKQVWQPKAIPNDKVSHPPITTNNSSEVKMPTSAKDTNNNLVSSPARRNMLGKKLHGN